MWQAGTACLLALAAARGAVAQGVGPEREGNGSPTRRPPFLLRLREDAAALGRAPRGWRAADARRLGLAAAAVAGTMVLDEEIREVVQRHRSGGGDRFARAIRPLGHRTGALALVAAIWASGKFGGEERLVAMGEDAFETTLFAAGVIAPVVKRTVGRARPVAEEGAFSFEPFSAHQSFPSGEATQAFAIAAVVAEHSHWPWVDVLAWSYAAAIAWQRLDLDRHWASDVVAGAVIGAGVGRWVVRRRAPAAAGHPSVTVAPLAVEGGWGVRMAVRW